MADYDTTEAIELLPTWRAAKAPERKMQHEVAQELVNAVCEAAKESGFEVAPAKRHDIEGGGWHIEHPQVSRGVVWLKAVGGNVLVGLNRGTKIENDTPVDLAFGPIGEQWRGKERDSYRAPVPGEPFRFRSAAAVVVERVVAALNSLG